MREILERWRVCHDTGSVTSEVLLGGPEDLRKVPQAELCTASSSLSGRCFFEHYLTLDIPARTRSTKITGFVWSKMVKRATKLETEPDFEGGGIRTAPTILQSYPYEHAL